MLNDILFKELPFLPGPESIRVSQSRGKLMPPTPQGPFLVNLTHIKKDLVVALPF